MGLLELATPTVAAMALGLLWVVEAVVPMLHHPKAMRWRQRWQHLCLAVLNTLTSLGFAGLTLIVIEWARAHGLGLLRLLPCEGLSTGEPVTTWWEAAVLAALAFVMLDGWHYMFHVLAHKLPVLWRFHAVHHTAEHLDATTAMRFHAGEIAVQCALSLPVYVLLGVTLPHVLIYQLVLLPVAMFHHANVDVPVGVDRWLKLLIVTPRMHLVHHSKWEPETDSNYASVLSLWDRVFGTFRRREDPRSIEVGLEGFTKVERRTVLGMLRSPLSGSRSAYGPEPRAEDLPPESRALLRNVE